MPFLVAMVACIIVVLFAILRQLARNHDQLKRIADKL